MSARVHASTLLERALLAHAAQAGIGAVVTHSTSQRWASATFVGARHVLQVEGDWDGSVAGWLGDLVDADLPLRGHLVADLIVVDHTRVDDRFTATLEALTVEEA